MLTTAFSLQTSSFIMQTRQHGYNYNTGLHCSIQQLFLDVSLHLRCFCRLTSHFIALYFYSMHIWRSSTY